MYTQKDFDSGGWTVQDDFPRDMTGDLKGAVEAFQISSSPDDLRRIETTQSKPFTNQKDEYQKEPSSGSYLQSYIPKSGAIIASVNTSPQQNIAQYRRSINEPQLTAAELKHQVPKLNRWSDVVWFIWAREAGNEAGNLRVIVRDNVINDDTKGVIDDIFKTKTHAFHKPWPGTTFDIREPTSEDGSSQTEGDNARALLGTPHGAGIAWMLADHKRELGERSLKITVFTGADFAAPRVPYYMVFELVKP
ncbi:MAG: hypothetical protein LQ341_007285 [Variospora aurantia]|nr:MAG: hypothetical protein LQ341_007285 [Variospora aurantia]